MFLGNPSLPLKVPVNEALAKVEKVLREKNWEDFSLGTMKLVLVPYFYFNYHYYREKESSQGKIIESSVDGFLALNGVELHIEEDTAKIIQKNLKEVTNNSPEIEFSELETSVGKKEQDEVLKFKVAEFFQIPKHNVVISSSKKYSLPLYETFITIGKETYQININAINGELIGIEKVPEREKGFVELTKEVIHDLSTPKGWLKYSKEMFIDAGKKAKSSSKKITTPKSNKLNLNKNFGMSLSFLSSKWIMILIILLALFLIFIAVFY